MRFYKRGSLRRLPPIRTSNEVGEATNVPSNIEQPPFPNRISFNFLPFSFLFLSRFLNSPSIFHLIIVLLFNAFSCSTSLFAAFSITTNSKPSVIRHQTEIREFFEIHTRTYPS